MQSSKEQQGEIRKPSSAISAQRNRGNQQNGKDQRAFQENQRYQGNISCKDGLDKEQKWHGPNKQKILRRGGKNTQKNCTKKDLNDQDNHNGVITHLEPNILECEVEWALESITTNKTSGGDGIPVEPFKSWKMML